MNAKLLLASLLFSVCSGLIAQESLHLFTHDFFYPSAHDNYNQQLYGVALAELEGDGQLNESIGQLAKSSFELDESRSIDLLLESIARSNDDSERNSIRLSIGNKYFDRKDYRNASKFYSQIHHTFLAETDNKEVNFKLGYISLLDKDFEKSESYFDKVANTSGPYLKDAQYYLGINQFHLNKVEEAVKSFEKVEDHPKYGKLIPFYLSQIYFKNEQYDEVIAYGTQRLQQPGLKNKSQIYKMLGLSYLSQKNDAKALEYLEQYAEVTTKLTENEFYQLGLLHYKAGNIPKATEHLKNLVHQNSETGQMSNYLLGAVSLRQNNKQDARSAFKQASKYDFFPDVKEESNFLYYKLSADMGEERTAINGLIEVDQKDRYYGDSQKLLADLLVRSSDHEVALRTIEKLPSKSPEILNTYQQLSFEYGMQLIDDGDRKSSLAFLKNAIETPGKKDIKAKAQFWSGYSLDLDGKKSESKAALKDYLASGDRSYQFESQYLLAYQEIENQKYESAIEKLGKAVEAYSSSSDDKNLFDDAVTRLADLELVSNNYEAAIDYYDMAIDNKAQDADYITYQKALIYGVNGRPYDKLTELETLIKDYSESEYRDDALFEVGESLIQLEKNIEAYQMFNSLTEVYKNSEYVPKAWMRMGLISYNQGDMEQALASYEKGLAESENNEDQREALIAIEEIYLEELNNPDAYFKFLESEIGYEFEDIAKDSITYDVAFQAYKDGRYEQAISLFDSYTKKFKAGFFTDDASYYQAESHALLKQYDKALGFYEKTLENEGSEHYESALRKAALISYNHSQDFVKSYVYYDKLITMEGSKALDLNEAALYSAFISENLAGVEKYGVVVSEHASADDESKGTAYYYLAKTYSRQNRKDEAIEAYTKVGRYLKNNHAAESSYNISKIFFDRAQYDSAEAQAFETTKRAAKYPVYVAESLILIGDIYSIKEDYLNASAAYESVIENFKDNPTVNSEAREKLETLNVTIEEKSRIKPAEDLEMIELDSLGNG